MSARDFSSAPAPMDNSIGKTEAGGIGGLFGDITGTNVYYRAARGQYGTDEANRLARDRSAQEASRGGEAQFTSYLMDAAQGRTGPSVAQQQLAQSTGRAQQQAASMAASARGPSRALAQRAAIQAGGQIQGEANAQAAVLRAQEAMGREQMVAENLKQRRLMDLQQQGYTLQEANAKLVAEMQAQQINADIAKANAEEAGKGFGTLLSAASSFGVASDVRNKTDLTPLEPLPQKAPEKAESGRMNAGAIMSMLSDRRAKELDSENATLRAALMAATGQGAISTGERDRVRGYLDSDASIMKQAREQGAMDRGAVDATLNAERLLKLKDAAGLGALSQSDADTVRGGQGVNLRPVIGYGYKYKDPNAPGAAPGPQVGSMAQDIERSDAAAAVKDTPRGKMVDAGRLTMALAPAVGGEQRRGDVQDARIADIENALRGALRATGGGSYGNEPMELGFDTETGIHRAQGSVIGETNEQRLARELEATLKRRRESPFNLPPSRYDEAGLDRASRGAGLEPRAGGMR